MAGRWLAFAALSTALAIIVLGISANTPRPPRPSRQGSPDGVGLPSFSNPVMLTLFGREVSLSGNTLTLLDTEGRLHDLRVDGRTEVERPRGHTLVHDGDVSRLLPSDDLTVQAALLDHNDGGHFLARNIDANEFVYRDGLVSAVGPDYLDLRRLDRLSTGFAAGDATRFYVDAQAIVRTMPVNVPARLAYARPGQLVGLQGFVADDGAYVAEDVYITVPN